MINLFVCVLVWLPLCSFGHSSVASRSHQRNSPSRRSYVVPSYHPRHQDSLGLNNDENTELVELNRQRAGLTPYYLSEKCKQIPDPGPCSKGLIRWFYNYQTSICTMFIYGGCDGNSNRFNTYRDCMEDCYPLKRIMGDNKN